MKWYLWLLPSKTTIKQLQRSLDERDAEILKIQRIADSRVMSVERQRTSAIQNVGLKAKEIDSLKKRIEVLGAHIDTLAQEKANAVLSLSSENDQLKAKIDELSKSIRAKEAEIQGQKVTLASNARELHTLHYRIDCGLSSLHEAESKLKGDG